MAGARPKPTQLKIINGNPGKRKLPENEPNPRIPKSIKVPDELSDIARKHWKKVVRQLMDAKMFTVIDTHALIMYCESYARWVHANEQIAKFGPITKSPKGHIQVSPFLSIANKAFDHMHKMLTEFGMTPSSRTRVQSTDNKKPKDPWDTL